MNEKKEVRVRFAPSPTGLLHIGGARTALYNYLFAKAQGGKFILRIEDTDLQRSTRESETQIMKDLKWCGITHDEGPDCPGDFGPYRQSERLEIYTKYAKQLIDQGDAYYCFLTNDELDQLTEKAQLEKKSPHAYHGKYRDLSKDEALRRVESGENHVIRFKNPCKEIEFDDMVRGHVKFPADMVGDFVIIRANGMPVYNYCCVIDDALMKISHVIRAEEHLNNSCRQLMIYKALNFEIPNFAHASLLVGSDRQKLSKRHGATSVAQYKDQKYLPEALINYLCLLGWSHPEEKDIFDINSLGNLFDIKRLTKAPALYDIEKLDYFNGQHIKESQAEVLEPLFSSTVKKESKYHEQSLEWKLALINLTKEKLSKTTDYSEYAEMPFTLDKENDETSSEILALESTKQMKEYLTNYFSNFEKKNITEDEVTEIMNHFKKELKIKGKPLFMGMRLLLTLKSHGPDLGAMIALTPVEILQKRIQG